MKPDDFEMFQQLLRQRSGLVLSRDKAYLLESRLLPVARRSGLKSLDELAVAVRTKKDESLLRAITEAMTTNESSFFRDMKPFDQFRNFILPKLLTSRASQRSIRIWSAACSSGQEPYSLSMLLKDEAAKLAGWRIEIVATDLSSEILDKAKAGIYTQFEVQRGLPINYLVKHFKQRGDKWELNADIRRMVTFREFNLLTDLSPLGKFDVVFCRNVLIYFDQQNKAKVLNGIANRIPPDGVLYLGGAETVLGVTDKFRPVDGQRGVYELSAGGAGLSSARPAPAATLGTRPTFAAGGR